MVPTLTLYWREYCHLCHDMLAQLEALRSDIEASLVTKQRAFEIDIVDIDANPEFEPLYDELVPVLTVGERELCHYFLNPAAVRDYLAEIR